MSTNVKKDIEGYEGLYSVTENGEVLSHINNKFLKPQHNGNGYMCVYLSNNKVQTKHFIHRLVAKAFIKNPKNKRTINHINGNKKDNRVKNLEWLSYSENHIHAYDISLKSLSRKLNEQQASDIFLSSEKNKLLAQKYKVSETTIRDIKRGRTWGRITGKLKC